MKTKLRKLALILLPLVLLLLIFWVVRGGYLSLDFLKLHFDELQRFYQDHPISTALVYFVLYVGVAALAIPGAAVLTLVGGALFGLTVGGLLVSFASTVGSTFAFLLARFLFQESLYEKYGDRIRKLETDLEKNGTAYLFFLRLNPVIPFFLINSFMGLTPMKTWTFFRVSLLGMLPGTLLYVNAGTQLGKIQNTGDILSWPVLVSFFLLGLFPLAMQKFLGRNKNETIR